MQHAMVKYGKSKSGPWHTYPAWIKKYGSTTVKKPKYKIISFNSGQTWKDPILRETSYLDAEWYQKKEKQDDALQ